MINKANFLPRLLNDFPELTNDVADYRGVEGVTPEPPTWENMELDSFFGQFAMVILSDLLNQYTDPANRSPERLAKFFDFLEELVESPTKVITEGTFSYVMEGFLQSRDLVDLALEWSGPVTHDLFVNVLTYYETEFDPNHPRRVKN